MKHQRSLSLLSQIPINVEIENETSNCKISGEHQIQTLRSVSHLRPGWTFEPRPKWPMGGLLRPTQMAVAHLRPVRKGHRPFKKLAIESNATSINVT